jgi:hypothetical protein
MTLTRRKAIALLPTSIVAALGFFQFGMAQTTEGAQNTPAPPAEIVALIDTVFKAFNS